MGDNSRPCTVWLGSETGILKGVNVSRRQAFNFGHNSQLSRQHEVRALCWADPAESELLVAAVDGTVKTFSLEKGAFTDARRCGDPAEDGCFVGVSVLDDGVAVVTCAEGGLLRVWRDESGEASAEIRVGSDVARMRQNPGHRHKVATGGKENCLKVWDLEKPDKPVFTARNLRDDWLDLRRPHWVRDMAFIPGSDKVVTCTGYHQVHLYDPSTPQRRPVLEATFGEYPLTALSLPATGGSVVVGNTHGQIAVLDLRKGLVRGCLKGLSGGVRSLQCHATQPVVASCGLDRFLRIHSLEDRRVQHKVYLKSRLNCLLLASRHLEEAQDDRGDGGHEVKEEDDVDDVWDAMERVEEREENLKRKTEDEEEEEMNPKRKAKGAEEGEKSSKEEHNSDMKAPAEEISEIPEKKISEHQQENPKKTTPEVEEEQPLKSTKKKKKRKAQA